MLGKICGGMSMEKDLESDLSLEGYVGNASLLRFLLRQRGYTSIFDVPGPDNDKAKEIKEQGMVEDWDAALYRKQSPFVQLRSCSPPKPDCELVDSEGRTIGVEVTELVSQATINWHLGRARQSGQYSGSNALGSAIEQCLAKKDGRLRRSLSGKQRYYRTIAILHTDEPALTPEFCRDAIATHRFPKFEVITEAYVLFPCPRKGHMNDEEADYCRVVAIPLQT